MAVIKKRFEVALDIADSGANREFTVVEGDSGNEINVTLTDGGQPVDISGCRVIAVFSKANGTAAQDSGSEGGGVTICGTLNNEVTIELFSGSVAPGVVECELQIYSDEALETLVTTARFTFTCRKAIMDADTVAAAAEYPVLCGLVRDMATVKDEMEDAISRCASAASACEGAANGLVSTWKIIRYEQEEA